MRDIRSMNSDWTFHRFFSADLVDGFKPGETVRVPHNAVDLPYNYFDETVYQRAFTYQRIIPWDDAFEGADVRLLFDAVMADATVWVNGHPVAAHKDGYLPFDVSLSPWLGRGDNLVTVRISGAESPEIPPFGGQIDYLTYAGIYRDVWLKVTPKISLARIKIETERPLDDAKTIVVQAWLNKPVGMAVAGTLTAILSDAAGREIRRLSLPVDSDRSTVVLTDVGGLELWDIDSPTLYGMTLELVTGEGTDSLFQSFGIRTATFTPEGFRLNGKPLKIRGLNRHQSFPYVGYAMGRRAQERDAEILKHQLKCNLVRTSHYPQSPWFLDHCDRIGLLVFEEIPGWQHIGGDDWKRNAVRNVQGMIERDWNHPSIVLWGVRINESADCHEFYSETNSVAHDLDPSRQTGGVRYIESSELLEDVYTMNDFVLGSESQPGSNQARRPLRTPAEVTGLDRSVPYLVTEFNGHMHPTKRFDCEQWQAEQVTRYLEILDKAYGDPGISGCIGWCMADYNTHKDFGSGDRICHHGVLDMFREPKFAAWVYISQCAPDEQAVLKPVTFWARGDREIGGVLPLIVLTNCDEVELRYGDSLVKRVAPDRQRFPHLPHAPVIIDHRHFSAAELGCWGMRWEDGVLTGYVDGVAVATVRLVAAPLPTRLEMVPDDRVLSATPGDATRIIVRALDQVGNPLPFLDDPVTLGVEGPARILGPDVTTLRGGTAGFWIETTGGKGSIVVHADSRRFPGVTASLRTE
jgi:beta-galactosidase